MPTVRKLTPVLVVEAVEPCLPFWRDRLGFEVVATVPHGGDVGFAMLVKDGVEVMYQSRASVADDVPALAADASTGGTALFLEVDDLDAVVAALHGVEVVLPRRTTFYGMDEIAVREPGGRVVTFAQPVAVEGAP